MERTINEFWKRVDTLLGDDHNQMWLADKTGIRQTTISGWRTNGRMPPADRAVKIAQVLDVSVEYLVTGITRTAEESAHIVDVIDQTFLTPENKEFSLAADQRVINIPIWNQKVSAGPGEEYIEDFTTERFLPVLERFVSRFNKDRLKVVEVKGDSMTGIQLFSGDLVVFASQHMEGDGVYVLSIDNEALVKRLEFDRVNRQIVIHSENKNYSPKTVSFDSENIRIEGKVVGWYHSHPY
jgi:phage repressor protein C with HTH and peptisase S24 domain